MDLLGQQKSDGACPGPVGSVGTSFHTAAPLLPFIPRTSAIIRLSEPTVVELKSHFKINTVQSSRGKERFISFHGVRDRKDQNNRIHFSLVVNAGKELKEH